MELPETIVDSTHVLAAARTGANPSKLSCLGRQPGTSFPPCFQHTSGSPSRGGAGLMNQPSQSTLGQAFMLQGPDKAAAGDQLWRLKTVLHVQD